MRQFMCKVLQPLIFISATVPTVVFGVLCFFSRCACLTPYWLSFIISLPRGVASSTGVGAWRKNFGVTGQCVPQWAEIRAFHLRIRSQLQRIQVTMAVFEYLQCSITPHSSRLHRRERYTSIFGKVKLGMRAHTCIPVSSTCIQASYACRLLVGIALLLGASSLYR